MNDFVRGLKCLWARVTRQHKVGCGNRVSKLYDPVGRRNNCACPDFAACVRYNCWWHRLWLRHNCRKSFNWVQRHYHSFWE